jgi:uncharacterized membrane protein YqjE
MNERLKAFSNLAIALAWMALVLLIMFDVVDVNKLTAAIAAATAISTEVYVWWKNNNVTKNAQEAQKYKIHLDSMGSE